MMLPEKLLLALVERLMNCQDFAIMTKISVLVSATVAAPLMLSISIRNTCLVSLTY